MNCPICRTDSLISTLLAGDLPAHQCRHCGGTWISSKDYFPWLRNHPERTPGTPLDDDSLPAWDTRDVRLCPEDGHILSRYRIWPQVEFWLDHCGHCNGVWLDKDEWQVLARHNLHDKLNLFFTHPWQEKLRAAETRKRFEAIYANKFGAEDYARLKETRLWLQDHPLRSALLAYLQADDPYQIP